MKTKMYILSIIVTASFMFQACNDETTDPGELNKHVLIEAESQFDNDLLQISLDDKVLLNSRVTTNYTISLAWGSEVKNISSKEHLIKAALPGYGIEKTFLFKPEFDTTSIFIRFQKEIGEIKISQIEGIMLRD